MDLSAEAKSYAECFKIQLKSYAFNGQKEQLRPQRVTRVGLVQFSTPRPANTPIPDQIMAFHEQAKEFIMLASLCGVQILCFQEAWSKYSLKYITEGKYWNQLEKIRKFRVVLSSGSHETGGTAKKVTASDSAKPGPHIHIFFLIQGLRVRFFVGVHFTLYLQGPWSLLAQIWYGDFYIWDIDAIKFLRGSGEGAGG